MIQEVHFDEEIAGDTTWKLSASGHYCTSSAYDAQFLGTIFTRMKIVIWTNWAPPKCKLFKWLIFQDRVWTAYHLQRKGWPDCSHCQLCRREPEMTVDILFNMLSLCPHLGYDSWLDKNNSHGCGCLAKFPLSHGMAGTRHRSSSRLE